tara:strand:+ start:116 stop:247 length:132 start_codon:yes stop_codon:yes gene_type:complete
MKSPASAGNLPRVEAAANAAGEWKAHDEAAPEGGDLAEGAAAL